MNTLTATPRLTLNDTEPAQLSHSTDTVIAPTGPGVRIGGVPSLGRVMSAPAGKFQLTNGMFGIHPLPN